MVKFVFFIVSLSIIFISHTSFAFTGQPRVIRFLTTIYSLDNAHIDSIDVNVSDLKQGFNQIESQPGGSSIKFRIGWGRSVVDYTLVSFSIWHDKKNKISQLKAMVFQELHTKALLSLQTNYLKLKKTEQAESNDQSTWYLSLGTQTLPVEVIERY